MSNKTFKPSGPQLRVLHTLAAMSTRAKAQMIDVVLDRMDISGQERGPMYRTVHALARAGVVKLNQAQTHITLLAAGRAIVER